jgi:hypothetical protein
MCLSCNKSILEPNEQELEYYNVYNVGDTLVFKSLKTGNIKRFTITSKQNSIYNGQSSKMRDMFVSFHDLDDPNITIKGYQDPILLSIYKRKNETIIYLDFYKFYGEYSNYFGELNTKDTISYFNKKYINYYSLYNETKSNDLTHYDTKILYWQKKYGVIKFDLRDGDSFVRTNIP